MAGRRSAEKLSIITGVGNLGLPCLLILLIYTKHKDGYPQSNHSQITRSKNSYSLIQSLPLSCTPACGHQFHALAVQSSSHPTHPRSPFKFTAPLSRIRIWNQFRSLRWSFFCGNSQCVKTIGCFSRGAPSLMSGGILNLILWYSVWLGFHYWGILNSPSFLILLIDTKDKSNKTKISDWPHVLISFKEDWSTW